MKILISIALGGSAGALSRYYLSKLITDMSGIIFPVGTLVVNLSGCLLIGFFYGMFDKTIIPAEIRTLINVGFIGAFTTFSTFALESINLLRDGEIKLALINITVSNILGMICILAGMYIAGLLFRN